jgi:cytochrome d ubiquinol oxidase subunit II
LTFVVLWTSFPEAYASITLTLSVPLMIAALGVLRGASFAFRTAVVTTRNRRLVGAGFATPERGGSISSTVEQIGRRRMRGSPARAAIHPTGVMPQPSDQR